jgi:hypothetical protein
MDGATAWWENDDRSGRLLDVSWKMDPVLELWVDVERQPTTVRLRGMLDGRTGQNLLGVVEELLADGFRHLLIDVGGLEVKEDTGFAILVTLEQAVRRAGGVTRWAKWSELRITSAPATGANEAVGRASALPLISGRAGSTPAARPPADRHPAKGRVVPVALSGLPGGLAS